MIKFKLLLFISVVAGLFSCKEPYLPPVISADTQYLVVEGVLNTGSGPTSILLTRTSKLDNVNTINGVNDATVVVEGTDNSVRPLNFAGNGQYTSPDLQLTIGQEYRVRIRTGNGKEYLSAYVKAQITPDIDSISWARNNTGAVVINANTHNDAGTTRYYRWSYEQTWEIRSYYSSNYVFQNGRVRERDLPAEQVLTCFKNQPSTNIIVGSSARLQSDVISQLPLLFIPVNDEKLSVRYSILVRQYALDKVGYEFFELMKKNTESLGTIFDAQPSEIRGNFTCINDPNEPVIGYLTASTITEKRIFIEASQVPDWQFFQYCESYDVSLDSVQFYFGGGAYIPYDAALNPATGTVEYYLGSSSNCVDCRTRGGVLNRPAFW